MKRICIISSVMLVLSALVYAQGEDQFLPSDQKQLTAVTEPSTLPKGFFRIGADYFYGSVKKIFNNDAARELSPGSSAGSASSVGLWSFYGFTDRIEANVYLPYMMNKFDYNLIIDDPVAAQTHLLGRVYGIGFGDISLGLRTQLLMEKERQPSVTLGTYLELPTGRKNPTNVYGVYEFDEATGSGEFALDMNAQVRKIIYPYSLVLYSGFKYRFGGKKIHFPGEEEVPFKSGDYFYVSAGVNFHLNDWICVTNDLMYGQRGRYSKNNTLTGDIAWEALWIPNIHFQFRKLRLVQGVMVPVWGRNTSADPRFSLSVRYIF